VGYILGRRELIDHILVSHALVEHVADGAVTPTPRAQPPPSTTAPTFVAAVPAPPTIRPTCLF
jgi:hypothetical protein